MCSTLSHILCQRIRSTCIPLALLLLGTNTTLSFCNEENDFANLVEQVQSSVVRLELITARGGQLVGSGFVVHESGLIATNYHVAQNATEGDAIFADGAKHKIIGYTATIPKCDLVIIKIARGRMPFSPLRLANKSPRKGEEVFTFGNPEGLRFRVTRGIVSAISSTKELIEDNLDNKSGLANYDMDASWIQTDATISPGSSGGPLINLGGEVVGVNTFSIVKGQNLNFSLFVKPIADALAKGQIDAPKPLEFLGYVPKHPFDLLHIRRTKIDLPDGRQLDLSEFLSSANSMYDAMQSNQRYAAEGKPARFSLIEIPYKDGAPFVYLDHGNGKLSGHAIALYESGKPMVCGDYLDGRRHGKFFISTEKKGPLLFADYEFGKKNGFVCLFENENPILIQEYKKDKPIRHYRCEGTLVIDSFDGALPPPKSIAPFVARLEAIEKEMLLNEYALKKFVRQIEEEERWMRVAGNSVLSQENVESRINNRVAERASEIQLLRQKNSAF